MRVSGAGRSVPATACSLRCMAVQVRTSVPKTLKAGFEPRVVRRAVERFDRWEGQQRQTCRRWAIVNIRIGAGACGRRIQVERFKLGQILPLTDGASVISAAISPIRGAEKAISQTVLMNSSCRSMVEETASVPIVLRAVYD